MRAQCKDSPQVGDQTILTSNKGWAFDLNAPLVSKGYTGPRCEFSMQWAWRLPCASVSAAWPHFVGVRYSTRGGLSSSITKSTRLWLPNRYHHFGNCGEGCPGRTATATTMTIPSSSQEVYTPYVHSRSNSSKAQTISCRDGTHGNAWEGPH